ncbi:MAG: DNA recombination protein RmuC, partial [Brevundimonas sp.]
MNASLVAALAAAIIAVIALAWALMERRRAGAAEARAWDLSQRFAATEARLHMAEDAAATQTELLRAQAAQSAQTAAEEMLKRTDETFRNRELMSQQRMEAQLKPVADTLRLFQEHVAALEKTRNEETGGLKEQLA